ncbi:MAG: hypothetical protein ACLFOY_17595 [Desulfatibacillaceae bacterium]
MEKLDELELRAEIDGIMEDVDRVVQRLREHGLEIEETGDDQTDRTGQSS